MKAVMAVLATVCLLTSTAILVREGGAEIAARRLVISSEDTAVQVIRTRAAQAVMDRVSQTSARALGASVSPGRLLF